MIVLVWPWDVGEDSAFPPWSTPVPEKSYSIAYVDLNRFEEVWSLCSTLCLRCALLDEF